MPLDLPKDIFLRDLILCDGLGCSIAFRFVYSSVLWLTSSLFCFLCLVLRLLLLLLVDVRFFETFVLTQQLYLAKKRDEAKLDSHGQFHDVDSFLCARRGMHCQLPFARHRPVHVIDVAVTLLSTFLCSGCLDGAGDYLMTVPEDIPVGDSYKIR